MSSKKYTSVFILLVSMLSYSLIVKGCSSGCNPHIPKIPNPNPNPNPTPTPSGGGSSGGGQSCPRDALKLGVCAKLLNGTVGAVVANPQLPCCSILGGLLDLEAAVCLCTAIKANILGININIPISLSLLVDTCGIDLPPGFKCAPQ